MIQTCNLKTTKIEKENHLKQTSLTLRSVLIYVNFPGYGILTHPFSSISSLCRTVFSPKVRLGGRFGEVKTSSKHAVLAMNKHQGRTNETKMDTNKNENQNIHHKRRKHHGKTSFTLENLLLLGYVPCKKYLKINGNKNKTSSRRWFLDPYLGGKGNVEMVLSLRFTRNVDEKMVVFLYKRCKESNKTYETYHICYIYMCAYISYSYLICLLEICWRSCFMINLYLFFLCNSESGIQLQQHQEHQPSRYYCIARGNEVCYLWLHSMKEEELVTTSAKETSEWMWSHDGPFLLAEFSSRFRRCWLIWWWDDVVFFSIGFQWVYGAQK